jgi:hypothetical protein
MVQSPVFQISVVGMTLPAACRQIIIIILSALAGKYSVVDMQGRIFWRKRPAAVLALVALLFKYFLCPCFSYHYT